MTHPDPGSRDRAVAAPLAVEDGLFVEIHGVAQWITVRGRDLRNPVLLMIGGPGAGLSAMAPFYAPWEADFTLVQWDQPRAGATFARKGAVAPYTIERLARDGVAVVEAVLARLGAARLAVLAISGGTAVALRMVKARPDLFFAYVGNGQVVSRARQEALSYGLVLDRARARGDTAAMAELERIGPPPWADIAGDLAKSVYANAMTPREQAVLAGLDPAVLAAMSAPPAGASYVPAGQPPQDVRAVTMAAFAAIKDDLWAFDAQDLGLAFEVPMIFLQGAGDLHTVTSEVAAYAAKVAAPVKHLELIEGAGHMSSFLRDDLLALLKAHVRPLA